MHQAVDRASSIGFLAARENMNEIVGTRLYTQISIWSVDSTYKIQDDAPEVQSSVAIHSLSYQC